MAGGEEVAKALSSNTGVGIYAQRNNKDSHDCCRRRALLLMLKSWVFEDN